MPCNLCQCEDLWWWAQPQLTLAWEDIKANNLSWRQLRELGLKVEELVRSLNGTLLRVMRVERIPFNFHK